MLSSRAAARAESFALGPWYRSQSQPSAFHLVKSDAAAMKLYALLLLALVTFSTIVAAEVS